MGRKRASRQSKTIGFKAFCDDDADILDWWESLPEGERSDTLRQLIREAITGHPFKSTGHSGNGQLTQVCEDTNWIRNALAELPTYFEQLMGQIVVTQPVSQSETIAVQQEEVPRLEQEAIERRRTKMRQNVW